MYYWYLAVLALLDRWSLVQAVSVQRDDDDRAPPKLKAKANCTETALRTEIIIESGASYLVSENANR